MFKPLNIMFCFFLFFTVFPVNAEDNFKVFVPEFIPKDASFEISIITSKNFPEAEKLDIYFFPDFSLTINEIELRTDKGEYQISLNSEYLQNYSEISQKVSIDLTDTSIISPESFFEIIVHLKSRNANSNILKFYSEYTIRNEILGHLKISNENFDTDRPDLYRLSFNYFEKFYTAESAARFGQNSFLNIPLEYNFEEDLAAEFWIKFKNYKSTFLEIVDWETNRVEYYLSLNENQMLAVNSRLKNVFQLKPSFISSNCWYHFSIVFDKNKSQLSFLCNDEEFAKLQTNNYLDFNNFLFHFKNSNPSGNFNIDQ
ncbi:MAG: hypothetical protein OQK65_10125, partial [Chlorobium sp.]|nr:hypothetical protein [Chlorobium sp.]